MATEQFRTYKIEDFLNLTARLQQAQATLNAVAANTQAAFSCENPFIVGRGIAAPNLDEMYQPFSTAFVFLPQDGVMRTNIQGDGRYMTASTSKPFILSALLKIAQQTILNDSISVEHYLTENKFVTMGLSPALKLELSDLLTEAKGRVTYDSAEGFLERDKANWDLLSFKEKESAIHQHISEHTTESLGINELINLALYYSGNFPIRFLRLLINHLSGKNDDETIGQIDQILNKALPEYSLLKGDIWGEQSPNVGQINDMARAFHYLIEQISAPDATVIDKQMFSAMQNNHRDVVFWSKGMLKWLEDIFPGAKLEIKTGDYPAIRYIKEEAEKGTPCHLILTVLVDVTLPNGKRTTFAYYAKYLSLMQADLPHVSENTGTSLEELQRLEAEYLNALLVSAGNHFRSAILQELYKVLSE